MCGSNNGRHICATCSHSDGCMAGFFDDDWFPANMEKVIDNLDNHRYDDKRIAMKKFLIQEYLYDYDRRTYIEVDAR